MNTARRGDDRGPTLRQDLEFKFDSRCPLWKWYKTKTLKFLLQDLTALGLYMKSRRIESVSCWTPQRRHKAMPVVSTVTVYWHGRQDIFSVLVPSAAEINESSQPQSYTHTTQGLPSPQILNKTAIFTFYHQPGTEVNTFTTIRMLIISRDHFSTKHLQHKLCHILYVVHTHVLWCPW